MTAMLNSRVRLAWLNVEAGCRTPAGGFDVARLRRLVAPLNGPRPRPGATPVAIFAVCEAKEWGAKGNDGLFTAARVVSETLSRSYVGKLCSLGRGPIGPALLFDSALVAPVEWHDDNGYPDYVDKSDVAWFRVVGTDRVFLVIVRHLSPLSPQQRKEDTRLLGRYGDGFPEPVFILGDLNETASGPKWPFRDWTKVPYRDRDAKAVQLSDGRWVDATDAIDHLIGWWTERPIPGRVDGCGFWAVPEIAHATGTPTAEAFRATVNDGVDAGGGQLIDHCLVNRPHLYVPGSYRIHVPARRYHGRWDSDHRLGEATFDLAAEPGSLANLDNELARSYRLTGEPQ